MKSKSAKMLSGVLCVALLLPAGCRSGEDAAGDAVERKIDSLFAEWDRPDSPGAAVAVLRGGDVIFKKGYGSAQLEYGIPITPSTIFHVASVSKQFTAFAVSLLAAEGRLSLDDDIRKHLPEVPDFGKTITIRHLIHHTSGLRDQWEALAMAGWRLDDIITREHILTMVRNQQELNFEPGERHLYCNTGYTLLGEIVARVTGATFSTWTGEHIFEPLGMEHTHFHDNHESIVPNRAYSYGPQGDQGFRKSVLSYANAGATSLFTTVEDLLKWAQNFLVPTLGGAGVMEQMQELGELSSGRKIPYAFGLGVRNHRGLRMISHGGSDAGFRSWLGIFPEQEFAVVVLGNLGSLNPSRLGLRVAELYLEDDMRPLPKQKKAAAAPSERKVADIDPMTYEAYVGRYNLEDGTVLEIIKEGDRLFAAHSAQGKAEIFPESIARFFLKEADVEIRFRPSQDGYVERLTVVTSGRAMQGKRSEAELLDESQMQAFAGDYFSRELKTHYSIVVTEGGLVARHFRHGDIPLIWNEGDTFTGRMWFFRKVEFQRGAGRRVTGFLLTGGRVWNLRFDKQSNF
jgi:CubicO group peptidase (beta-lactamase class C family)